MRYLICSSLSLDEERRASQTPTDKVFIVGFDPRVTDPDQLKDAFSKCGTVMRIDTKKNYAFVTVSVESLSLASIVTNL